MLMASCLGSGETYSTDDIKDAQIASLTLSHDSVAGLENVKFTIDQVSGLIFNNDSLPYGTKIEKVVCTLTYSVGVSAIKVEQKAEGDTAIWWNGTDSLNFALPIAFTTIAYDGATSKNYTAWVNIHQEKPDSMVWQFYATLPEADARERNTIKYTYNGSEAYLMYTKTSAGANLYYAPTHYMDTWQELPLADLPQTTDITQIAAYECTLYAPADGEGLYQSDNGLTWTKTENAPPVKTILGVISEQRNGPPLLAVILKGETADVFASMNRENQWTEGDTVPGNFPRNGFAHISYTRMNSAYLSVVAGKNAEAQPLNTTWTTSNGTAWALLSGEEENFFEKKSGAMLAQYDDKFYLIGGIHADNKASKDIHLSVDNGATWFPVDSLKTLPESYQSRGYASVDVNEEKYLLLFGGKTSEDGKSLNELWRGRINRLK
jgi:hypothetical protein